MREYCAVNDRGVIVSTYRLLNDEEAALNCPEGCSMIRGQADRALDYFDREDRCFRPYPDRPHPEAEWGGSAWILPSDLDVLWAPIRARRDDLLRASDWALLPDSPLSSEQQEGWRQYRQALRDITGQADPCAIVWPESP